MIASLVIGAREADTIALTRQRETIEHALDQHGLALARELRVQTVWTESYERTRARDTAWMQTFYGSYLTQLLGYDRIYVLASDNTPVFGFVASDPAQQNDFSALAGGLRDLIKAVRDAKTNLPAYNVVETEVPLGNGTSALHRAVADVRAIGGRPATVVVSSILPDRGYDAAVTGKPMLLVAVEDLDKTFTKRLGDNFGFRDMAWTAQGTPSSDVSEGVKSVNGTPVGLLSWRKSRPGLEFIRRVAPGLGVALLLVMALTYLLILWGKRQAKRLVQSEEFATLAARTDPLTGLPNRFGLQEAFTRSLAQAKAKGATLGILSVNIDQFKGINDAFGHGVGDAVLNATAKRLQRLLPAATLLARPHGDNFIILIPGLRTDSAAELAADVIATLAEPVDIDGTRVFAGASVGFAIAPRDGDAGDELLRRADLAVDKAKAAGGGTAAAFAPEMDSEVSYRRALEQALRTAVAEGNIDVAYQPLMDPSGTQVLGVEALARWRDDALGTVSPEIFIPLAEETGLIPDIGVLVLRRAVEDGRAWPDISVAVNVSASQIHHGDVVEVVRDVLRESRFPANRLEIEITESVLLADEKRANEQMRGLQSLGVKVALDDFGTGYSSLQYLRRFGFDKLKIDRSFIDGAGAPQESSVILASIIRLGQDLNLTIVAEGVETDAQQRWLQGSGCHQLQGFLFSRPLTVEQMTQFIAERAPKAAATG
ncbi:MAG: bifunctional diguanylate cyclase/phosphodiesterase [Hyphomicrobium sp.]